MHHVNAGIVGCAGLLPTVEATKRGKTIAIPIQFMFVI
jgi:1-deoxy-D-xylulose 5-phosphate reductoisomerase